MELGLKEIGIVVALATAGCTSPNPEDARDETHPVYAVSDVHGDTITDETVADVRKKCRREATEKAISASGIMEKPIIAGGEQALLVSYEQERDRSEAECLALNGVGDDSTGQRAGGFQ